MTEFERIKAMDVVDLAIYLADLQLEAVNNFHFNRVFPKGYYDHIDILEGDAKVSDVSLSDKISSAVERSTETDTAVIANGEPIKD